MEIIFKILAIALITSIASLIVRPVRNDFAVMIALTGGVVILVLVLSYLTGIFDTIKNVIDTTGVSSGLYSLILKIVGIGYLVEFTAGVCSETGNSGLGDKVLLGGKVVIMVMALPIVTSILQIIMEILPK
jgi:stage III sporulation protein AD